MAPKSKGTKVNFRDLQREFHAENALPIAPLAPEDREEKKWDDKKWDRAERGGDRSLRWADREDSDSDEEWRRDTRGGPKAREEEVELDWKGARDSNPHGAGDDAKAADVDFSSFRKGAAQTPTAASGDKGKRRDNDDVDFSTLRSQRREESTPTAGERGPAPEEVDFRGVRQARAKTEQPTNASSHHQGASPSAEDVDFRGVRSSRKERKEDEASAAPSLTRGTSGASSGVYVPPARRAREARGGGGSSRAAALERDGSFFRREVPPQNDQSAASPESHPSQQTSASIASSPAAPFRASFKASAETTLREKEEPPRNSAAIDSAAPQPTSPSAASKAETRSSSSQQPHPAPSSSTSEKPAEPLPKAASGKTPTGGSCASSASAGGVFLPSWKRKQLEAAAAAEAETKAKKGKESEAASPASVQNRGSRLSSSTLGGEASAGGLKASAGVGVGEARSPSSPTAGGSLSASSAAAPRSPVATRGSSNVSPAAAAGSSADGKYVPPSLRKARAAATAGPQQSPVESAMQKLLGGLSPVSPVSGDDDPEVLRRREEAEKRKRLLREKREKEKEKALKLQAAINVADEEALRRFVKFAEQLLEKENIEEDVLPSRETVDECVALLPEEQRKSLAGALCLAALIFKAGSSLKTAEELRKRARRVTPILKCLLDAASSSIPEAHFVFIRQLVMLANELKCPRLSADTALTEAVFDAFLQEGVLPSNVFIEWLEDVEDDTPGRLQVMFQPEASDDDIEALVPKRHEYKFRRR